jgi:hypothetical protein
MPSTSISIWFNENGSKAKAFAEGFGLDLKRCLTRYLPSHNISTELNKDATDFLFVIISKEESNDQLLQQKIRDTKCKNMYLVHIEPIDQSSKLSNHQVQPHLFWDKQFETAEIRYYRRDDNSTKAGYWEKITDLAIDIQSSLIVNKKEVNKPKVYLSVDDSNNSADRENLMRDLNDMVFEVLPNKPISTNFEECSLQISEALSVSKLIIHIIPPFYNVFFADSHLSLTEHQCNISAGLVYSTNSHIYRVIWIPSAYEITDEENQIFIEKIQRDHDQTRNTTVLKSSIEDLKKHYRHLLSNEFNPEGEDDGLSNLYLISDNDEVEKQVKSKFSHIKLRTPSDFKRITFSQHLNELARAKMVVVCYTTKNDEWLAVKANDILKSKGLDTSKQFERIVLMKGDSKLETSQCEGVFTDIVSGLPQLEKTITQIN